jgi:hypothetical protein
MAIEAPNTNNRIESETISYKDALAVISNEVKNATVSSNRKIESITNPDYAQIIKEIKSPESIWKMK